MIVHSSHTHGVQAVRSLVRPGGWRFAVCVEATQRSPALQERWQVGATRCGAHNITYFSTGRMFCFRRISFTNACLPIYCRFGSRGSGTLHQSSYPETVMGCWWDLHGSETFLERTETVRFGQACTSSYSTKYSVWYCWTIA